MHQLVWVAIPSLCTEVHYLAKDGVLPCGDAHFCQIGYERWQHWYHTQSRASGNGTTVFLRMKNGVAWITWLRNLFAMSVCAKFEICIFSCWLYSRYRTFVYWGDPEHCWPLWKDVWLVNKDKSDGSSSIRCCKGGCRATGVATDSHGISYRALLQADQQVSRCEYDARYGCVDEISC